MNVLARPKSKITAVKKTRDLNEEEVQDLIQCTGCGRFVKKRDFYRSYNPQHALGVLPYCKECWITQSSNMIGEVDLEKFKHTLMMNDRPYVHDLFVNSYREYKTPKGLVGNYIKRIALQQYRDWTWKDSIFEAQKDDKKKRNLTANYDMLELEQRWGSGFSDVELVAFERKFEYLKSAAPPQTPIHEDAMMTYIRYRVKADLAISRDDVSSAQKWGQLASQAQETAKLAPNKLTKSDLSGGIDNFAELSKQIELAVDGVVPILPKFVAQPKDLPDMVLYAYINYNREVRGLPPTEYSEIYSFYRRRAEEVTFSDDEDDSLPEVNVEYDLVANEENSKNELKSEDTSIMEEGELDE